MELITGSWNLSGKVQMLCVSSYDLHSESFYHSNKEKTHLTNLGIDGLGLEEVLNK
jgi:hypothetical protein